MYILFTILIVIASVLLILLVLVQNSKGGGLSSNFSSSNQIMGVRKTTDFLEKATWTLACTIVILSVSTVYVSTSAPSEEAPVLLKDATENAATYPYNAPKGFSTSTQSQTAGAASTGANQSASQEALPKAAATTPAEAPVKK